MIASAAALSFLIPAGANAAVPLQPTAKWSVDFGDAHCLATRDYGTEDNPLILALRPSPIGEVMTVTVLRKKGGKAVTQFDGTMTVDNLPPVKISMLGYAPGNGKHRLNTVNLSAADFMPVRQSKQLRLRASGELDHAFALSNMAAVTRTLDECVTDLRRAWHVDDEKTAIRQAASSTKPLHSYFTTSDYPGVAVQAGVSGMTSMMLLIDEAGKLANCMVVGTSGYASLDAQSCAVLKERAKFVPALGIDGKPTKSGILQRIRWQMPG